MQIPPPPPPPLAYRHTAAGVVTAIVIVLAALTHGATRQWFIVALLILLVISVGVFSHLHRVIGHLWREWRERKTGQKREAFGSRWRCVVHPISPPGRYLTVELVKPQFLSEWTQYYDPYTKQFTISGIVSKEQTVLGTCTTAQQRIGGALGATYPIQFGIEAAPIAPIIEAGKYRFEWQCQDTKEILAFTEVSIDDKGQLRPTINQRLTNTGYAVRTRWRQLTKPL